jgi:serine/threonine protein phosphatase PrpC
MPTLTTCPHCGADVRPGSRFCSRCGRLLTVPSPWLLRSGDGTDRGQTRQLNEDHALRLEISRQGQFGHEWLGWYMVADGLGGHAAGERASEVVGRALTEFVIQRFILGAMADDTQQLTHSTDVRLREGVMETNQRLYEASRKWGNNMASTLVGLLVADEIATIVNVGDSRCYLYRRSTLTQITRDHSLAARQAEDGANTTDGTSGARRNVVLRVIGAEPMVKPDFYHQSLEDGDRFLLCTDGLWGMISDADIAALLGEQADPGRACTALIDAANAAGGTDNVAVIVVDCFRRAQQP